MVRYGRQYQLSQKQGLVSEDDHNGRQLKWKTTKRKTTKGRQPKWKTTKMKDDKKGR